VDAGSRRWAGRPDVAAGFPSSAQLCLPLALLGFLLPSRVRVGGVRAGGGLELSVRSGYLDWALAAQRNSRQYGYKFQKIQKKKKKTIRL